MIYTWKCRGWGPNNCSAEKPCMVESADEPCSCLEYSKFAENWDITEDEIED